MKIIPVIDLMAGKAVHARCGQRNSYQSLRTHLCADGDARALARFYASELGSDLIYIADLDAIEGRGLQIDLLKKIATEVPAAALWVDAGVKDRGDLPPLNAIRGVLPVIGSERLLDPILPTQTHAGGQSVLSLDFFDNKFLGPPALQDQSCLWPRQTILMDISRVGSARGPNFQRLARYRRLEASVQWFVAGGVKSAQDLASLREQGAAGVLLATSLHNGHITCADVAALAGKD